MSKDEALKLALEALESAEPKYTRQRKDQKTLGGSLDYWKLKQHQRLKAITAIKEALSQPEQEPCQYCGETVGHNPKCMWAQPEQEPLTKDQRIVVFARAEEAMAINQNLAWRDALVIETEAAHGIKENT